MMMPKRSWLRLSLLHLAVHLLREHAVSSSFAFVIETRTVRNRNRNQNLYHKHCFPTMQTVPSALRYKHLKKGSNPMRVLFSKPEEYDDGIGDISNRNNNNDNNNNDNSTSNSSNGKSNQTDGEALAAEFYKTLQQRQDQQQQQQQQQGANDDNDASVSGSESSVYSLAPPSPSRSQSPDRTTIGSLFDADERDTPSSSSPPARKFTGRPADSYFGGGSGTTGSASSGNASGNANAVRERMMRREYDLVSGATGRTALGLQAGIALSMLVFFVYVGLTGGIVSGEEAIGADFGGDDFIQFEEIIPVPRDSDASVWI